MDGGGERSVRVNIEAQASDPAGLATPFEPQLSDGSPPSRSHELEWQHQATWSLTAAGRSSFRLVARSFRFVFGLDDDGKVPASAAVAPRMRRSRRLSRWTGWFTWSFLSRQVGRVFYWLQLASATACVTLSAKLARDHDNCSKIGNARGLLDKIIDFSAIGAAGAGPVITPSRAKAVKRSLQEPFDQRATDPTVHGGAGHRDDDGREAAARGGGGGGGGGGLRRVAETTSELECFHVFSGSAGLSRHAVSLSALVDTALELMATRATDDQ
uniref:Uncharacterized protein n=1 Tax=Oryza brachyantha TaxID=4533 RepID=J3NDU4_ORYBR